ncbi:hypothetical protein K439DRAFT_1632722 [Ramaria rubella]|nr:hypothetical protein K439DRAFT_1632722 [Ramaria rubella]
MTTTTKNNYNDAITNAHIIRGTYSSATSLLARTCTRSPCLVPLTASARPQCTLSLAKRHTPTLSKLINISTTPS